ncbi:hypothetical protein QAD02_020099 [Eretmocerus hayati]|uniref:Uncharacterized protein n=1 Tax=Eretmocerus hayati TaxID=131215 RepID=A0ACC2PLP9_9HYME|nr:hypothetical protein QAD02_020099 [Eretmocerus hayati]
MVDVMQNRAHEIYARLNSRPDPNQIADDDAPRLLISELRRLGQTRQKRPLQNKETARAIRDSSLFRIKESEISISDPVKASSFLHYCCGSCTPSSKDNLVGAASRKSHTNISNLLVVPQKPGLVSRIFPHTSHVYGLKKYDYPRVTQSVLEDERLRDAIRQTALADSDGRSSGRSSSSSTSSGPDEAQQSQEVDPEAYRKAEKRAISILERMQSRLNDVLLRLTAWTMYKLLPCFIQSAAVHSQQLDLLKEANESGLPLVFMPLHRSHLDYIMISFLSLTNNIKCPLVAAGDNLRIPLFGWLMSGLGAFFIKRRMDPVSGRRDLLYRATLHTYIMECLRAGHNLEFFVEGGRTRTGKPCMPKGGILSVVVDALSDGSIEDALIVPVSMNYERLVDGNFTREQLGQPKPMETFGSAIKAIWDTLRGNYGIVKIEVCQPFSLKEMIKFFQTQQNKAVAATPSEKPLKVSMSTSSLYGTDVVAEEYRQLVDKVARHVVYDCSQSTPIMSTNVVAFLLLNKFRDGCTLDKLVEAFDEITDELECAKRDVAYCGETIDIVNHALEILGPGLVKQQRQEITDVNDGQLMKSRMVTAIRPVSILPNVIELSYYSNTMLSFYVLDSIVVTAFNAVLLSNMKADPKAAENNNVLVSQESLVEKARMLCEVLKYEFIFCKPCQDLDQAIVATIERLVTTGIIQKIEAAFLEEEIWSKKYSKHFDDSSDEEFTSESKPEKIEYKLSLEPRHSKRMEFLHTLLRPLIDTYVYSAFCLRKLVDRSLSERDLIKEICNEIQTNLDQGIAFYGESLCVDPIKNSLKLFEKMDILECHIQDNIKLYYLKDDADNDESAKEIYDSVAEFQGTRNNG